MPDKIESLLERIKPEDEVNWKIVKDIVEEYANRHPEEFMGCVEYVKSLRKEKINKFAVAKDGEAEMRHIYELPSRLARALSLKYPLVLSGKNLKQFLKFYPIFQIPEYL